ncbi:fluoroacetate dehalogenase [Oxobacter pfennigii]|uniref:Fluoroacetate dehalogenase n=1 Tax=Oxobacter pfennigii TaxID=36849 RepID=A0A0P8W978_9CLOT|nr:alpha/beta hydrolase [Oxobacter pfennigii]KPU45204.1 fluoroacetate dehalogenase [Oxobacter pfennigii]
MYKNPYEHTSGIIKNSKVKEAGFEEQQFFTGQINMNYVSGPDNGVPLVLIPAQMGTWESYKKVMIPLSEKFKVYVVEIRGHGKSSWTPGNYSWKIIGEDMKAFLKDVVKNKAIIAGNSSGGIIALWCAANLPDFIMGAVIEDAPVFSAEIPRFKEQDKYVYNGLKHLVDTIGNIENRDIANYFKGLKMPVSENRNKEMPDWFVKILSKMIKKYEANHPGQPLEVGFADTLRVMLKSLSMFDPDFSRAFVDGRFYEGIDHKDALSRAKCPLLIMHANWHRYKDWGLVGAMDDEDAAQILKLAPHAKYIKIPANHVIHVFKPKLYIEAVENFAREIEIQGS